MRELRGWYRRFNMFGARTWNARAYAVFLLGVFIVVFALLAIDPTDRAVWAVENALVVLILLVLVATHRAFPLSRVSYTLIFAFLCVHELGSHYTYSEVPYDAWFRQAFGFSLDAAFGFERNHFDRFVHFFYGLFIAYPIREVFIRIANVRGFWGYFLPLDLTMSTSLLFELLEWGAAEFFGGDLGPTYLGTQGDVWDAHKDMALASLGALTTMLITGGINYKFRRDFAAEMADSFRVKRRQPLGESAMPRLLRRWLLGPSRK